MARSGYIDPLDMDFDDCFPVLGSLRGSSPLKVARWEEAQRRYRAFTDRFIRPVALEIDRRSRHDHEYLAWDFCRSAAEERMLSIIIPPMFGGQGADLVEFAIMLEELCSGCTGLGNVVGAHYLGYAGMAAGMDMGLLGRVSREIVEAEKRGEPLMLSAAHTEPSAGSDVEDEEAMHTARVHCAAKKVEGGYVIGGTKVFISDGHFATYHITSAYTDLKRPIDSGIGALVKTGDPGFTMVKHEHKMGQRACPASTLVFEDCFVPDDRIIMAGDGGGYFERVLFVLGTSRVGVAAIAAGCARGAYEQAIRVAKTERFKGRFLIDEQWVQMALADMLANVMIARSLYLSAAFCEQQVGMMKLLDNSLSAWSQKITPGFVFDSAPVRAILGGRAAASIFNRLLAGTEVRLRQRGQAHSSAAKWVAGDLAMKNADLAMEIAGAAGIEQSGGVEKVFRDAKLLQIYEGTNQINRKHLWDSIIIRQTTM